MKDNSNPKLLVSKTEASEKIREQIDKGKELCRIQIYSEQAYADVKHERKKWVDYNQALCRSLFNNSPLSGSHGYESSFSFARVLNHTLLAQNIEALKKVIGDAVNELEGIDQRLDLYEETTPIIEKCRQAKTKVVAYKEKLQKEIPGYIKAIILGIIGSLIATVIVTYIAC